MKIIDLDCVTVAKPVSVRIPVRQECHTYQLTQEVFEWPADTGKHVPFFLPMMLAREDFDSINFPYRVIGARIDSLRFIAVRTDAYPWMWLWWWFVLRLETTAEVLTWTIIRLLVTWDLVERSESGAFISFKNLRWRSPFRSYL